MKYIENIDTDKLPMIDVNETIVVSVSAKAKQTVNYSITAKQKQEQWMLQ